MLAISNNCQLRCRNEKLAIKVLAESTLAAQDGCIYYLAAAASLQQWGQAALAFLVLRRSERGLSAAQLCEAVESTLEGSFRVSIYCRRDMQRAATSHAMVLRATHCRYMHKLGLPK